MRDFKSIATCDVPLDALTLLVGANATGKSVFLDALRFVQQAIGGSVREAIGVRGGLDRVLRQVPRPADSFEIILDVTVPWGKSPKQWAHGRYGFEIARLERPGHHPFVVRREHCQLEWNDAVEEFRVDQGQVRVSGGRSLELTSSEQELYLPLVGGTAYGPLIAALRGLYFYAPDLPTLRSVRPPTTGETLGSSGEHLGDVLRAMEPATKQRFDEYMQGIIPNSLVVDRQFVGSDVTVGLWARSQENGLMVPFAPEQMSDGTVRAAGVASWEVVYGFPPDSGVCFRIGWVPA